MCNFRVNQKVVCKRLDQINIITGLINECPALHEIVTINEIFTDELGTFLGFDEYDNGLIYDYSCFEKLDHSFAENLLAEITKNALAEV